MTFAVYLSCWESLKIVEGVRGGKGFFAHRRRRALWPEPQGAQGTAGKPLPS